MRKEDSKYYLLLFVWSAILFVPFLGSVHLFDWDEINFAENAREMIMTGDYLNVRVNYEVFYEKPPLFIWMQAASMHVFGMNEFAARFPNAIAGFVTLLSLFAIGKKHFNPTFGMLWALGYSAGIFSFLYFKSGIIDPWFNFFIFHGIYFFVRFVIATEKRNLWIALSALSIGLGILTKGPVALLLFLLVGFFYLVFNRFRLRIGVKHILLYTGVVMLSGGFWFILQIATGNFEVVKEFVIYQIRLFSQKDAGHGGFPGYHFVIMLIGMFPLSVFAIRAFRKKQIELNEDQALLYRFMRILFWVVMILFSIVQTKIIHYSSLAYFPLSFLATLFAYQVINHKLNVKAWHLTVMSLIAFIYIFAITALPIAMGNVTQLIDTFSITDAFTIANLQADVLWSLLDAFPALILLGALVVFFLFYKSKPSRAFFGMYTLMAIFTFSLMTRVIPKIEPYSQGAAIEFFESKAGEDCYVQPLGYKSYAHLFYTKKLPVTNRNSYSKEWLGAGEIDKPCYFVTKVQKLEKQMGYFPEMKVLYEKNGFVFLKREINHDK